MDKIFLLGGHDLEMIEIRKLLESKGMHYEDRHLSWDNASLSAYSDIIDASPDAQFYGIELKEDIPLPSHYVRIDHHNDFNKRPAAILQTAQILGVPTERRHLLVAANDAGYIPAMMADNLNATQSEIDEIRRLDRLYQGVTAEDELLAQQSIDINLITSDDFMLVKSLTSHFSPICDRLFPYERLLIYTDTEWVFYGKGKDNLVNYFKDDIDKKRIYHGGGDNGFIGAVKNAFTMEEIQHDLEAIHTVSISKSYSTHIFMFPFCWKVKNYENSLFSEQVDLKKIPYTSDPNWKRVSNVDSNLSEEDLEILYNEGNYFYEFVHSALYDGNSESSSVRHFECIKTKNGKGNVTYTIVCGNNERRHEYILDVYAINLNLYATGVGVLSFYMHNNRYPDKDSVFAINQYGRRVFLPFFADKKYRNETAHSICLKGLHEKPYFEDFSSTNIKEFNKPASFISDMIKSVTGEIEIKSVVDDRMFVLCWYKNDDWAQRFVIDYDTFINTDENWYKFVFVDAKDPSCQNDAMRRKLLKDATYERWQKWSSLYGISRYSMVYLTNSECPLHLTSYFETMYARMVELVLMQRASVLRFSSEVARISHKNITGQDLAKQVSSLYKEYIHFENKMYFREVSAQEQAIELYQKLLDAMGIKEQVEKLDDEIGELYNYASLCEDRRTNKTMLMIAWITATTVLTSIFSMTDGICSYPDVILMEFLSIIAIIALFFVVCLFLKNKR